MGTGKRLLMAALVVGMLGTFLVTPTLPASATGPVAFEHVFSDGDPLGKAIYTIPDLFYPCGGSIDTTPFVFRPGAYVLLIASSSVLGATPVVPVVTGKGLSWSSVDSRVYVSGNLHTRVSVFQAWADNPDADPETSNISFDFGSQTQIRNSRSFIQSTGNNVDRSDPIRQIDWAEGTGTSVEDLALQPFGNATDNATVQGVVLNLLTNITHQSPLQELGETNAGASPCNTQGAQHKLGTAYDTGEVLNPTASWASSTAWAAVGIEVVTEGGGGEPPPTTTTNPGPTTTIPEPTTTTIPGETTTTTTPGPSPTTTVPSETPPTTTVPIDPPIDAPTGTFVDDDDSVFETDIERIADAGITLGCNPPTNDRFCPDDTVTRGQMAAFLSRALGLTGDPLSAFVDDDDSVFETDIERIADAGITLGCNPPTNDRFCPDDTVTRGQMAAFLSRALGLTGDPLSAFVDDDDSVFETDIERIADAGITLGCNPPTNDRFCPDDTVTRGQMAAFLSRTLDHLAG